MSKVALTHQVVGVEGLLDVGVMNTDSHAHEHVLRTLGDLAIKFEQIGTLKGLETKVVVIVVPCVVDVVVENIGVGHDDLVNFLGNQWRMLLGFGIDVFSQVGDDIGKQFLGGAVKIVNANTSCQTTVIRMVGCKRGCGLCSELVQLTSGDAVVKTLDGQFCDVTGVNPCFIKPFGQGRQFLMDGIKTHIFSLAFSIHNLHSHTSSSGVQLSA